MFANQHSRSESIRQLSGVPHLESIRIDHDFDTTVALIRTVRNGIDDEFGNGTDRQFVHHIGIDILMRTDSYVDMLHDESDSLVHQFEDVAFEDLVTDNRFALDIRGEDHALDFASWEEMLWVLSKEQERRVGQPVVGREQVQMAQDRRDILKGVLFLEATFLLSQVDEVTHLLRIDIVKRCHRVIRGIPREEPEHLLLLHIMDQRGIDSVTELIVGIEGLTHHLLLHLADESLLLRVARVRAFDKDEAMSMCGTSGVKLPFGRRDALLILVAIELTVDAEVDVAMFGFMEVGFLRGEVDSGEFLEDKRHEELTQQRIRADVFCELFAFVLELRLNAADEDSLPFHMVVLCLLVALRFAICWCGCSYVRMCICVRTRKPAAKVQKKSHICKYIWENRSKMLILQRKSMF